jgi:hypothetical protein
VSTTCLAGCAGGVPAELGMSETRYFQLLLALLERVEVADTEPELVARLRSLRERRRRWR